MPKKTRKAAKSKKLTPEEKRSLKKLEKQKKKERKRETDTFIRRVIPLLSVSVVLGAVLSFAIGPKLGIPAGGGIMVLSLSYMYPRRTLWFFLIYLPFSGTVTYALGGSAVLQLAKDGFFFPALLGLMQQLKGQTGGKKGKGGKKESFVPQKFKAITPWAIALAIYCVLVLLVINGMQEMDPYPNDKSPILVGVLGYKVFLGYVPLIFCTYHLIRGPKELLFTTRLHTGLAIACALLGLVQYQMLSSGRCEGTDHLAGADLFKASLDARCFVGGSLLWSPSQNMIRLPGTFVAPWQWAWFLISNAFLTFTTAFNDPSPKWRIIGLLGMGGIFINAVISGQRIALVLVPAVIILLLILTGQVTDPKRFLPIGGAFGVGLAAAWILFPEVIQERIDSFVSRWNAAPADDFIGHQVGLIWEAVQNSFFLMGWGIGRATNSARLFGETKLVETWFPKVMYEIGVWGLILFLIFVTAITITTFKAYRSVKDRNLRGIGASYWVFILFISYQTYYYPLDVDPVAVYYWYTIGVVLKLPAIAKQAADQLEAEQLAEEATRQAMLEKRRERLGV